MHYSLVAYSYWIVIEGFSLCRGGGDGGWLGGRRQWRKVVS